MYPATAANMLRTLLLLTAAAGPFSVVLATDAPLPALPNDLCDLDTVYDSIRTGDVVEHELEVRYRDCPSNRINQPCGVDLGQGSPGPGLDGVRSNMITINNDNPAPTIHANLGDTIRVTVVNYLSEPTDMNFHGITQFRTPYMDGDEMVANCPIPSGFNFTYEFIAHPAGSTFYHSHTQSQRVAGMMGALIVHDPANDGARDDASDHVAFFTDWYHQNADDNFEFWAQNAAVSGGCLTFGGPRFSGRINPENENQLAGSVVGDGYLFQSLLVNGRGSYDYQATQVPGVFSGLTYAEQLCPGQTENPPLCEVCLDTSNFSSAPCTTPSDTALCGQMEIFNVMPGRENRLRYVHGGALFSFQICIDGHPVHVIAADGGRTQRYPVDCVLVNPGERYDVLVNATLAPGDYLIRFTTTEQQNREDLTTTAEFGADTVGLPHQAFALLRYAEDNITAPATAFERQVFTGQEPPPCGCTDFSCTYNFSSNCNADYWLTSSTLGCSMEGVRDDPDRCKSLFDLRANYTSTQQCGGKRMAHEAQPTVEVTTSIHWTPDEVPRWQGLALSGRMEIIRKEDKGFPYITPTNSSEWGVVTPISFVGPPEPVVPLSLARRREIYDRRVVFRPMDEIDPYLGPNTTPPYPEMFAQGTQGVNTLEVKYGDVVRVFIKCSQPYGSGCAMGHPMHIHGFKMAVIGYGDWDEAYNESNFNLVDPVYRDTAQALTDGWMVLQFIANNPGVWRFHCQVNIHHRGGMAMLFDVGGDDDAVMAVRRTPPEHNMCPQYQASTATTQAQTGPTNVAIAGAIIAIVCVFTICVGVAAASWTTRK